MPCQLGQKSLPKTLGTSNQKNTTKQTDKVACRGETANCVNQMTNINEQLMAHFKDELRPRRRGVRFWSFALLALLVLLVIFALLALFVFTVDLGF